MLKGDRRVLTLHSSGLDPVWSLVFSPAPLLKGLTSELREHTYTSLHFFGYAVKKKKRTLKKKNAVVFLFSLL